LEVCGGRTFNRELVFFLDSLEKAGQSLDGTAAEQRAEDDLARPAELQALAGRLDKLEKMAGRWLAKTDPSRHSPRGRYWAPPARKPAAGRLGIVTRDRLVVELQKRGFRFRIAREIVKATFAALIEALEMGETLETLLGNFELERRPQPKRVRRLGREVVLNQHPKRVAFRPALELKLALEVACPEEIPIA
jgi:nucleoid DNA-binding protein